MFIVFLKFGENKDRASRFMTGHKEWISRGFEDGVFLVSGSLQPRLGGAVLAHNVSRAELEDRVNMDPFVAERVVNAEILEISPGRTDERLGFLQG